MSSHQNGVDPTRKVTVEDLVSPRRHLITEDATEGAMESGSIRLVYIMSPITFEENHIG